MRTRIKVCGITNLEDARGALDQGADFLGMIFTQSPRQIPLGRARAIRDALPPSTNLVGVFADEAPETVAPFAEALGLHAVQVSGWIEGDHGLSCEIWHVVRAAELPDPLALPMVPLRTYLLDAHDAVRPGGTGMRADWTWAKRCVDLGRRLIVAGGLRAENVAPLIHEVRPFGVDASSGLEAEVGKKSPEKVRAFIEQVRDADRSRSKRS